MSSSADPSDSCANADVVNKYKSAASVVNDTLKQLLQKAVPGANIYNLCVEGDALLTEGVSKAAAASKSANGIAFPTCISVNNIACHYSPAADNGALLQDGDLVKIELGAHIDGFPVLAAQSVVIGASASSAVKDARADVMQAAYQGAEAALRVIGIDKTNTEAAKQIEKVIQAFKVKPIEGTMTFQLSKNALGGEKNMMLNPSEKQRRSIDACSFGEHEVYCVDVAVSSKDGKPKPVEDRATIFRKTPATYSLKMKTSKAVMNEINKKCGSMAFNIRSLEDVTRAKLGLTECLSHNLVQGYEALKEPSGAYVARFMFTVILMPNGPMRLTELLFDPKAYVSQYAVEDAELKKLLQA